MERHSRCDPRVTPCGVVTVADKAPRTGPQAPAAPAPCPPGDACAPVRRGGGGIAGTARRDCPAHCSADRGRGGTSPGTRASCASAGWWSVAVAGVGGACLARSARCRCPRPTTGRRRGVGPRARAAGRIARIGRQPAGTGSTATARASRAGTAIGGGRGWARDGARSGRALRLRCCAGAGQCGRVTPAREWPEPPSVTLGRASPRR